MRSYLFSGLVASLAASPALAGPPQVPDLEVSILLPTSTPSVKQTARYQVRVRNIGKKNADGVSLTIQLPKTGTSPQVYIMGTLGARDGRCALGGANGTANGTKLVCGLNTIFRNGGSTLVYFDLALPEKTGPLVIDASATTTTTPEPNTGNNSDSETASLLYPDVAVNPDRGAVNRHCTGQGLTAFHECTLFPSSIASHSVTLLSDGSISITGEPDYTGRWSQPAPNRLEMRYYLTSNCNTSGCSNPEAEFSGRGVNNTTANCFEGLTTFPGSVYVAPYEVCLQ